MNTVHNNTSIVPDMYLYILIATSFHLEFQYLNLVYEFFSHYKLIDFL